MEGSGTAIYYEYVDIIMTISPNIRGNLEKNLPPRVNSTVEQSVSYVDYDRNKRVHVSIHAMSA